MANFDALAEAERVDHHQPILRSRRWMGTQYGRRRCYHRTRQVRTHSLSSQLVGSVVFTQMCSVRRHQTTTQKVVQVRMWAQGLTVGLLIGAGILTQSQRKEAAAHRPVDHSWKDIVRVISLPMSQLPCTHMCLGFNSSRHRREKRSSSRSRRCLLQNSGYRSL